MITSLDKPLFFTKHILKRMAQRGLSKKIIEAVVRYGNWENGKVPFSYTVEYKGIIVVLYSQKTQYNVGTCKLNREYTCKAEKLKQELNIDFYKALHLVIKEIDLEEEIASI